MYVYIEIVFFYIHSPVDGHLGCFCILAPVNIAVINIGVHVSFWISVFIFFGYVSQDGISQSHSSWFFSFWGNFMLVSIEAIPINIPTNSV